MIRRLFWDAEFSANTAFLWRPGRKINVGAHNIIEERQIICICWKWQGQSKVHSLDWGIKRDDSQLLSDFIPVIESADEAVAHYGDGYDWPMFLARCAIRKLSINPMVKTVDTCKLARKFGFNARSLDYLAGVLDLGSKQDTGFDLWRKVVLEGDENALRKMVRYCGHDVKLLEGVFDGLAPYCPPKTHSGVMHGLEKWSCPYCAFENVKVNKTRVTAAGTTQKQMQCLSDHCGRYYSINMAAHKKYQEHLQSQ